MTSGNVEHVV